MIRLSTYSNFRSQRRNVITSLLLLLLCSGSVFGQDENDAPTVNEKKIPTIIKSWTLGDGLIRVDTVPVDSSYWNLPNRNVINDYSIANSYNGNLISPIESKIYFDRLNKIDFLFGHSYQPYIITPSDVRFYNTTKPYSTIAYKKGFKQYHEENDLDFAFSGNLNRRTNLGITLNYLNSVGHYESQAGKRFAGSVFGSYNGDKYSFQGGVTFNKLSNFENGGLDNTPEMNYLNSQLETEDYPVRMEGMSDYRYISGFFNHYYSICVEREREVSEDSVAIDYIPVTTFEHTFDVTQSTKEYVEKRAEQGFFPFTYHDMRATSDTAEMLTISNRLAVTFEEEFNKWLRFGATVYAVNTFERYSSACPSGLPLFTEPFNNSVTAPALILQNDTATQQMWTNNTYVGGSIYKRTGKYVRYNVMGDVCLVGYRLGEFKVQGDIETEFKLGNDTLQINADAYIKNEQPNYFLQHYVSNHYQWDNDFAKPYKMYISGTVGYPTKWVDPRVQVSFENILHHIYFDQAGMPQQHDGNVQVLAVDAQVNLRCPWLALDNTVIYQHSTSATVPLPAVALYHNLYYYDWWFKTLFVQIGVDMRYNTSYYAPLLNPATGQFCVQDKQKVGNHPILNLYGNFYVKALRLRLFAQWQHFNDVFTKNKQYFSMPDYPYNPSVFRAGLAWSFYN